jgi:hypothetical protein
MQQYRHYQATLEVFRLHPDQNDKSLEEIVMFLAQVNLHCNQNLFSGKLVYNIPCLGFPMLSRRPGGLSSGTCGHSAVTSHCSGSKHENGVCIFDIRRTA